MLGESDYLKPLLLVLFLALSAFFSGSETAFIALQRVRLIHLVRTQVPGAERVMRMAEDPERLFSSVLLGNNLANTAAAALGTAIFIRIFSERNINFGFMGTTNSAILLSTLVITSILLIFSEILPKTFAARNPERISFMVERPLRLLEILTFPLSKLLQLISSSMSRLFGGSNKQILVTEQEIRSLILVGREAGAVEAEEAEMLEKVFHFGDSQVSEIMTPRPEIIGIENLSTLQEFISVYSKHQHSRFPVFESTIDNVMGILSIKNVFRSMADVNIGYQDTVTHLLRDAYFVPESKGVGALFAELKERGETMAMIVDEFGGIAGLVTLRQLVAVIVGNVREEDQPKLQQYSPVDENTFILDASVTVNEAYQLLSIKIPSGHYQTVAGFILSQLGKIPTVGDHFQHDGVGFTVTEMEGVKIESITIKKSSTSPLYNIPKD